MCPVRLPEVLDLTLAESMLAIVFIPESMIRLLRS